MNEFIVRLLKAVGITIFVFAAVYGVAKLLLLGFALYPWLFNLIFALVVAAFITKLAYEHLKDRERKREH